MKRFFFLLTLAGLLSAPLFVWGVEQRCDYYRVDEKRLTLYEDSALSKVRAVLHEGDIIEVYEQSKPKGGELVWRGRQYIPEGARRDFAEAGCSVNENGYVKMDEKTEHGVIHFKAGRFIYAKGLKLSPIDPPDAQAMKHHKTGKWQRFWLWFDDLLPIIVVGVSALAILISLFRLKLVRPVMVGLLSFVCLFWFYGKQADTYVGTFLLGPGIFMPFAFANLLLPWGDSYARKERMLWVIVILAAVFSFGVSYLYLSIQWESMLWRIVVSAVVALLDMAFVAAAGELKVGDVCPECGFYGLQNKTDSQVLRKEHGKEYTVTEYRRVSDNKLDHTETEVHNVTTTTSQIWRKCGHCGHAYTYTKKETY